MLAEWQNHRSWLHVTVKTARVDPMVQANDNSEVMVPRLLWRSRRGLLELELLLRPFAEAEAAALTQPQLAQYAQLLEHDDLDIYDWLCGRGEPSADGLRAIVRRIREFHRR